MSDLEELARPKVLEDKTHDELVEQIRRMQDRALAQDAGRAKSMEAVLKRCADFRKAARIANRRADEAEAALKAVKKALATVEATLQSTGCDE